MAEDASTTSAARARRPTSHALLRRVTFTEMAAAAVVAGGVTYVLGWLVLLVRLSKAEVPQLEALAVIPREVVLLVGLQGLILPALPTLVLLVNAGLTGHWAREAQQERGTYERNRAAFSKWAPWIIVPLLVLYLAVVPWRWGAAALVGYVVAMVWVGLHFSVVPLRAWLALGVSFAFVLALAREADAPIRLHKATVVESGGRATTGLLVASTDRAVYLGQPTRLLEMRVAAPARVVLGDRPPDARVDPPSLGERIIDLLTTRS